MFKQRTSLSFKQFPSNDVSQLDANNAGSYNNVGLQTPKNVIWIGLDLSDKEKSCQYLL